MGAAGCLDVAAQAGAWGNDALPMIIGDLKLSISPRFLDSQTTGLILTGQKISDGQVLWETVVSKESRFAGDPTNGVAITPLDEEQALLDLPGGHRVWIGLNDGKILRSESGGTDAVDVT